MIYDKVYDNLENCPFCGSKEFLFYSLDVYDEYQIRCGNCDLVMKDKSLQKLLFRWNKRFPTRNSHFITNNEIDSICKNLEELQKSIDENVDKIKIQHDNITKVFNHIKHTENIIKNKEEKCTDGN